MDAANNKYIFVIDRTLKTTRPGVHIKLLEYWGFEDNANICVVDNLNEYLERTRENFARGDLSCSSILSNLVPCQ